MVRPNSSQYVHFNVDSRWRIAVVDEPGDIVIRVDYLDAPQPYGKWQQVARLDESSHGYYHAHIPPDIDQRIDLGSGLTREEKIKTGFEALASFAEQQKIAYKGEALQPKNVWAELEEQVSQRKAKQGSTHYNVSINAGARIVQNAHSSEVTSAHKKHFWLYVLKLEQEKYYIGITTAFDPYKRIAQHQRGYFGAQWTKKHKPIEILEVRDLGLITQDEAEIAEDRCTNDYMKRFGYQNVRGGTLSYSGKYARVGSWFMRDEDWKVLWVVLFMIFALTVALIQLIIDRVRQHS